MKYRRRSRFSENRYIYRSDLASFTTSKNRNYTGLSVPPLTFSLLASSLKPINKKCDNDPYESRKSTYLCKRINNPITNSDIKSLVSLNATFISLLHARLTLYITGDKKGGHKTSQFNALVRPNSRWKTNQQETGLSVLTSYLCLIFLFF